MADGTGMDLVDWRELAPADVAPLYAEQADAWSNALGWDLSASWAARSGVPNRIRHGCGLDVFPSAGRCPADWRARRQRCDAGSPPARSDPRFTGSLRG